MRLRQGHWRGLRCSLTHRFGNVRNRPKLSWQFKLFDSWSCQPFRIPSHHLCVCIFYCMKMYALARLQRFIQQFWRNFNDWILLPPFSYNLIKKVSKYLAHFFRPHDILERFKYFCQFNRNNLNGDIRIVNECFAWNLIISIENVVHERQRRDGGKYC